MQDLPAPSRSGAHARRPSPLVRLPQVSELNLPAATIELTVGRRRLASVYYKLGRDQSELDFVDVDISGDVPLFIDPAAIRLLPTHWAHECISLLQHFFERVLSAISAGDDAEARRLLAGLGEPNETHLGFSTGRARGHGLGPGLADELASALGSSRAVASGLLVDLEDTVLLVPGVGPDIISDIVTNLIRAPLILYTQSVARQYGIPLKRDIDSGPIWDIDTGAWHSRYVHLPVTSTGRLLLVPKVVVRRQFDFAYEEYFRHYLLPFLADMELSANTKLVQTLKDGRRRVTAKSLIEKYGSGKDVVAELTGQHPQILADYREKKREFASAPLRHEDFIDLGRPGPNWDRLLTDVITIEIGHAGADSYVGAVSRLVEALFAPDLSMPRREVKIHEGRKRVDLVFVNSARQGFFAWVSQHYPAAHVFIECKNYTGDPANPELDQLAGRFSPSRGRVGLLICRTIQDKDTFIRRCRDTAVDDRGWVIPLDDTDLQALVTARREKNYQAIWQLLKESRFDRLVL